MDLCFLKKWSSGEEDAFLAFYDQYKGTVFKTAFLISGSFAEAEDITQEVFLAAWKARHTYNPEKGKLATWLTQITVRQAIRQGKKQHRWFPLEEVKISSSSFPEDEVVNKLECQAMLKSLDELPVKQRTVIVLRYFNDLSLSQIAATLKIPLGTVKSRLHQGLRQLGQKIYPAAKKENLKKVYR